MPVCQCGVVVFYPVPARRTVLSDTKHRHLTTNSFQVTREPTPPPPPPSWGGGGSAGVRSEPTSHHQTLNTNTMKSWQEQSLRRVRETERASEHHNRWVPPLSPPLLISLSSHNDTFCILINLIKSGIYQDQDRDRARSD